MLLLQVIIGSEFLLLKIALFLLLEENNLLWHLNFLFLLAILGLLLAILLNVVEHRVTIVPFISFWLHLVHEEQLIEILIGDAK